MSKILRWVRVRALSLALILASVAALVAVVAVVKVTEIQRSQTANRAANVGTWCGAIKRVEGALTAYVGHFSAYSVPSLRLPKLDCKALEVATRKSTH